MSFPAAFDSRFKQPIKSTASAYQVTVLLDILLLFQIEAHFAPSKAVITAEMAWVYRSNNILRGNYLYQMIATYYCLSNNASKQN